MATASVSVASHEESTPTMSASLRKQEQSQQPLHQNGRGSNNHKESKTARMDATLLRNALRLVHCIQKERGASCAYFASAQDPVNTTGDGEGTISSNGSGFASNEKKNLKRNRFESQLQQARMASNVALQLLTDHLVEVRQRQEQQKRDDTDDGSKIKARSKLSLKSPTLPI